MKKVFMALAIAAMFAACGTKAADEVATAEDSLTEDTVEVVVDSCAVVDTVAE